jgi:hypothetical protein
MVGNQPVIQKALARRYLNSDFRRSKNKSIFSKKPDGHSGTNQSMFRTVATPSLISRSAITDRICHGKREPWPTSWIWFGRALSKAAEHSSQWHLSVTLSVSSRETGTTHNSKSHLHWDPLRWLWLEVYLASSYHPSWWLSWSYIDSKVKTQFRILQQDQEDRGAQLAAFVPPPSLFRIIMSIKEAGTTHYTYDSICHMSNDRIKRGKCCLLQTILYGQSNTLHSVFVKNRVGEWCGGVQLLSFKE